MTLTGQGSKVVCRGVQSAMSESEKDQAVDRLPNEGIEDPAPSERAVEVPRRRERDGSEEEDEGASRKRLLLVVPLIMAAGAIVALVLVGMQDKGIYSKPVDELVAQKSKFVGKSVRAEGLLVHGSLVKRDDPCEYRFKIEKNGTELPVRFAKCVVPDTFRDVPGTDVGVTVE